MKVLLDECVDRRLARDITGHELRTVPEAGWAGLKNEELLGRAQEQFDVFVAVDKNLPSSPTFRFSRSPSSFCARERIASIGGFRPRNSWPDLDEDIDVEALPNGRRSNEAPSSLKKWLSTRQRRA